MSKRNKFARVILMVIPVILVLGFVNVSQGWTPANLEDQTYFGETVTYDYLDDDVLVGVHYFAGGWCANQQVSYDNSPMSGDAYNVTYAYWSSIHNATQTTWDAWTKDYNTPHDFRYIDWERKYLFKANQGDMDDGQNFWTMVRRGARFKQVYGHLFNWSDPMYFHRPLSVTDGYLGEYNCDDDEVWQEQIDAAADHGVDFFVYQMKWNYDGGYQKTFPPVPLDQGFLAATNKNRLRFAYMWVNHDWGPTGEQNYSTTALNDFIQFLDDYYFCQPNYLKIDGKPVLYIYNIDKKEGGLKIDSSGNTLSVATVYNRIQTMRSYAQGLGYEDIYIVGMGNADYDGCDFDAISDYNNSASTMDEDYDALVNSVNARWTGYANANDAKFIPAVSTCVHDGVWTGGSRLHTGMDRLNTLNGYAGYAYPDGMDANSSNPTAFGDMVELAKDFVESRGDTERIVMINAWNEWGEGGVIEPTQQYGWGYLENLREVMGHNPLSNWGFEDGTSDWTFFCPGSGSFTTVTNTDTSKWTGDRRGRISGATAATTFAHQSLYSPDFVAGRDYHAWCKIKTTSVAGNGARLRIGFRNSSGQSLGICESDLVTGTVGDFVRVSVSGTIPANTYRVIVMVCGSTNQGSGAGSVIEFDDVVFKTSLAAPNDWPRTTTFKTSDDDYRITGDGGKTIQWATSGCTAATRIYYREDNEDTLTYFASGASGSQYFGDADAGHSYTFYIYSRYSSEEDSRLLNSFTIVCHPDKPSGYTVDDYEDGSQTQMWSSQTSTMTESNGSLRFYTTDTNPYYAKYGLSIATGTYDQVRIRMKVNHGDTSGRIYWYNGTAWNSDHSQTFTVNNDGQWHEYVIDLSSHAYWTGTVTHIRLDPATTAGAIVEVDYIVVSP